MTMKLQNPADLTLPASAHGGGLVLPFDGQAPQLGENVFLAHGAVAVGAVRLADRVSLWFGAVVRGDFNWIEIGEGSNIQDNCMVHVADDGPCIIGRGVVVGHNAVVHACTIEDHCLIGIGANVLDYAVIGHHSVVGAGALVTRRTVIPPYSLVLGAPARVAKTLTPEESAAYLIYAGKYERLAECYRHGGAGWGAQWPAAKADFQADLQNAGPGAKQD
jgi:carbonic anhydrase/acetyltransferase-like protein (isoleucine patch superfamily)